MVNHRMATWQKGSRRTPAFKPIAAAVTSDPTIEPMKNTVIPIE